MDFGECDSTYDTAWDQIWYCLPILSCLFSRLLLLEPIVQKGLGSRYQGRTHWSADHLAILSTQQLAMV
jgi:hypothetical protein